MNQSMYRRVVNASGHVVAAPESARASHGSDRRDAFAAGRSRRRKIGAHKFALGTVTAAVLLGSLHGTSQAQVKADLAAPVAQRPMVLPSASGGQLVNITTPSAAGVSRNAYTQFDVQAGGVTLNNARTSNPLINQPARIILNEVRSSVPSLLAGNLAVRGTAAAVVVANPSGLTLSGVTLSNIPQATFVTGRALFEGARLTGLETTQGMLTVAGQGLKAPAASRVDLIARTINLAGAVEAGEVNAVAGAQHYAVDSGQITTVATTLPKPAYAVDVSALAGVVNANRITLVATEAGVGVRNAGTLRTNEGGSLIITAEGRLENTAQGRLSGAVVSVSAVGSDIVNAGSVQATNVLALSAGRDLILSGRGLAQTAGPEIVLSAQRDASFLPGAELSSAATGGSLAVSAGANLQAAQGAKLVFRDGLQLLADGAINLSGASLASTAGHATLLASRGLTLERSAISAADVHLETGKPFDVSKAALQISQSSVRGTGQVTAVASGDLRLLSGAAASTIVGGDVYLEGDAVQLRANAPSTAANGIRIRSVKDLIVRADGLIDSTAPPTAQGDAGPGAVLTAGHNLLMESNAIDLTGGLFKATGDVRIATRGADTTFRAALATGGGHHIAVEAGGDAIVSSARGNVLISGGRFTGNDVFVTGSSIRVAALEGTSGSERTAITSELSARKDLTVNAMATNGSVAIEGSGLLARGNLEVQGNGAVSAGALLDVTTLPNRAASGVVRSRLEAGAVSVQGSVVALDAAQLIARRGNLIVSATKGALNLGVDGDTGTDLDARGKIGLQAHGAINALRTQATAGTDLWLTSATSSINTTSSIFGAAGVLTLGAKGAVSLDASSFAGGAVSVYNQIGPLALSRSTLAALKSSGTNTGALNGKLSVESGGTLAMDRATRLSAETDLTLIQGAGDLVVAAAGTPIGTLFSDQLSVGRDLSLFARGGTLRFEGAAGSAGVGSSAKVAIRSARDLHLAGSSVHLQGTQLEAARSLVVTATGGSLTAAANLVTNVEGRGSNNFDWDAVTLKGDQVDLRAGGNIELDVTRITGTGTVSVHAAGNLTVASNHNSMVIERAIANGSAYAEDHLLARSTIEGTRGVALGAQGGTLVLSGADVQSQGNVTLQALKNVVLEAPQEHMLANQTTTTVKRKWYGKKKVTTTNIHNESLVADPVLLEGRSITIKAGNSVLTYAAQMNAAGNLYIEAGDEALYYAVQNQVHNTVTTAKTSTLWDIKFDKSTSSNSRQTLAGQPTVLQSRDHIVSLSGGDTLLQGTEVHFGGTATFSVGVGEKARADAQVRLEGLKTTVSKVSTRASDRVVWQSIVNQGSTIETLRLPDFTGPTKPMFNGKVVAQLPAGEFKTQVETLSKQPGLGYLNDLITRRDVDWQSVKLAVDEWNYKQQGLTPAGAALVGIAVAWATGGTGAGLLGLTNQTAALMANTLFTSLAQNAAIGLINNKGNIGATLRELGSSAAIRSAVSAALTAGAMQQITGIAALRDLQGSAAFRDQLTFKLVDASGRAIADAALMGGDLEAGLKASILSTVIDTAHANAASHIKLLETNYLAHKLAHALTGCAAAAAQGKCRDGAIGAAVGEVVAGLREPKNRMYYTEAEKRDVLAYSKVVAGAVAAYAGGNVDTAVAAADNAISNNAFFVAPLIYWLAAATAGYTTLSGNGNPVEGLREIGRGNDPLSKALGATTAKTVELSMEAYPRETTALLNMMAALSDGVDATVTYADKRTGRVVSRSWNSIDPDTRNLLIGAGSVASVFLPATGVTKVRTAISTPQAVRWVPGIAIRGNSWETYLATGKLRGMENLNERVANHKTFDFYDPSTGTVYSAKTMDTMGVSTGTAPASSASDMARRLKGYVNDALNYEPRGNKQLDVALIRNRVIELAIPDSTTSDIRAALDNVRIWAQSQNVTVNITLTKP